MDKTKIKLIAVAGLFVLILASAAVAYRKFQKTTDILKDELTAPSSSSARKNNTAPDFTVFSTEGKEVKLSDFAGKPVIVNFWASWCPPCRAELPDYDNLAKEYGEKIQFMMVNLTDGSAETIEGVTDFVHENGWLFPLFFDTKQSAARNYRINSIPVSVFIKADGTISDYQIGMLTEKKLNEEIKLLINEQ